MQKYYPIILLTIPLLLFAENNQSVNDSQDWQLALTSGDTASAIGILTSSNDSSKILIARDLLLKLYEKDPLNYNAVHDLGYTYMFFNEFEKAENHFHKAIKIDNYGQSAYYNLACIYFRKGNNDKGFNYLEEAFKRWPIEEWVFEDDDLLKVKDNPKFAELLNRYYGESEKKIMPLLNEGAKQTDKSIAIKYYKKAVDAVQSSKYLNPYILSNIYISMAGIYSNSLDDVKSSITYRKKALNNLVKIDLSINLAIQQALIGFGYNDIRDHENALKYWISAALNFEKLELMDKAMFYYSLISGKYIGLADFDKTIHYGEIVFDYYNSFDEPLYNNTYLTVLDHLITSHIEIGRYDDALKYINEKISVCKVLNKQIESIDVLVKKYEIFSTMGMAEEVFHEMVENAALCNEIIISQKQYDHYTETRANASNIFLLLYMAIFKSFMEPNSFLSNIDYIVQLESIIYNMDKELDSMFDYFLSSDYHDGDRELINIVKHFEGIIFPMHKGFKMLLDYKSIYSELDDLNLSGEELDKEALKRLKEIHPDIDWKALRESGDPVLFLFDDALKYYTAETDLYSLEYQKANKAQYYIVKGKFLANTADSSGYHKAIDMVKLGLEVALELDQKDKIIEASTFLGKFYYEIKDFAESMQNYNNALAEIEKIRVRSPEEYKSSYLDNHLAVYNEMVIMYSIVKDYDRMIHTYEMMRSRSLLDQLYSKKTLDIPVSIVNKIQNILKPNQIVIYFNFIFVNKRNTDLMEITIIDRNNIQHFSDADNYFMDDGHFANLINKYELNDGRELIGLYRQAIQNPIDLDYKTLSKDLYTSLIPIELKNYDEIFIVPHIYLGLLPFETLLDENDTFLCEKFNISYIQSLSVLNQLNQKPQIKYKKPMLAFGGVEYEKVETDFIEPNMDIFSLRSATEKALSKDRSIAALFRNSNDNIRYKNLPHSLKEVKKLKKMMKGTEIFTGKKATEKIVKSYSRQGKLSDFEIIHFSTHAKIDPNVPALSSIILFPQKSKKGTNDGYLSVNEISQLDMNVNFVNLSACQTGVGKISVSEGIMGFTQAFMKAGVNSLSVSLWPILDESSSEFMVSMYKKVEDGATYSKAINETKRDFIIGEYGELYKHPFFWAPYVYYGK